MSRRVGSSLSHGHLYAPLSGLIEPNYALASESSLVDPAVFQRALATPLRASGPLDSYRKKLAARIYRAQNHIKKLQDKLVVLEAAYANPPSNLVASRKGIKTGSLTDAQKLQRRASRANRIQLTELYGEAEANRLIKDERQRAQEIHRRNLGPKLTRFDADQLRQKGFPNARAGMYKSKFMP